MKGTQRDAILFSVSANAIHGIRRTNEDKRRAVTTMLTNDLVNKDENGNPWSDRAIGNRCGVDHKTVASIRESLGKFPSEERAYTTKHGTTATMKTGGINAGRESPKRETQTVVVDTETGEEIQC